jgi:hypothetical protein
MFFFWLNWLALALSYVRTYTCILLVFFLLWPAGFIRAPPTGLVITSFATEPLLAIMYHQLHRRGGGVSVLTVSLLLQELF